MVFSFILGGLFCDGYWLDVILGIFIKVIDYLVREYVGLYFIFDINNISICIGGYLVFSLDSWLKLLEE